MSGAKLEDAGTHFGRHTTWLHANYGCAEWTGRDGLLQ